jgi:hypothetical protein
MTKSQSKNVDVEAVPTPSTTPTQLAEQTSVNLNQMFVVTRGGLRVSDQDYISRDYPTAIAERDFWRRVVDRYPDGTRVDIVSFDKKKHRIW